MKKVSSYITFIVILAIGLGNAGSTLYLSSLVKVSEEFSTTSAMMKLTLSFYLVSFGFSQLIYGPLSSSFGRKKILCIGLFIALIGGVISGSAENIQTLLLGRLLEGLGYGATNSVGFAMFRDVFDGKELSRKISLVSVYLGVSSTLAVLLGGYIVEYIGWRYCFALLGFLTLIAVLINLLKVPETNRAPDKKAWLPWVAIKSYLSLCSSLSFLGSALATGFSYGALLALYSMLPFLIIKQMHLSPSIYGWCTVLLGIFFVAGANTAKAMVAKLSLPKLFMLGALISIIACGCGYSLNAEGLNVFAIVIPSMIACFGLGICVPISASCTISCFPKQGGSSAGLLGTFQFIFASIFTGLGGKVPEQTQGPMFLYLLVLMIVTLLLILPKYFRLKKNY